MTIDWTNLVAVQAGSVKLPGTPTADAQASKEAWDALKGRFAKGEVGFYDTPVSNELSQAEESLRLADSILKKGIFTDCLYLGIGGSSLGPSSLLASLADRCNPKGLRLHFLDNPDPMVWNATIKNLNPASTLVCVVTKSGTTFETIAQFLLAMEWLGEARRKSHLVIITDPAKGDLKAFAQQEDLATLHIAPSIGGRFSIFSPVGLFPAALAGLSVQDFMTGAKQVRDYIEKTPLEKNPIFLLAQELIRHYNKRPVHVCMPYSTRMELIGAWFVQLWGESLGKDGKGFTPIRAVGATDQHSILQLLRDGPDDKVTMFLTVDHVDDEVKVPDFKWLQGPAFPALKMLSGHTLQNLLRYEYRATSLVLSRRGRPNLTFQIDRLDERNMGALYFTFSVLTAVTGTLWGINPFDQPGVEEGKVYIRNALSQTDSQPPHDSDENSPVNRLRRNS